MKNLIRKIIILSSIVFISFPFGNNTNASQENIIYIGWASEDITPAKPVLLIGQFNKRVSKYVHDPLTATALALETKGENGKKEQAIMISCDQVGINKEIQNKIRNSVKTRIPDFDVNMLFLNATHTHTAPSPNEIFYYDSSKDTGIMTSKEFGEFLVNRATEAAVKAWNNRKPGSISWGLGHAVVGHNRRAVYEDGSSVMYGRTDVEDFRGMEGPSDHGVEMLFAWDQNEKLTGIVINIACPSQIVENEYYISADYWSEVRKQLKQKYSLDLYVLGQCGTAGDQSPRDLPRRRRGEPGMWNDEAGMIEVGKRVTNVVDWIYPNAKKGIKTKVNFKHIVKNIALPVRKVSKKEYDASLAICKTFDILKKQNPTMTEFSEGFSDDYTRMVGFNRAIVDRYNNQVKNPYFDMELHVIRLGDVAFATNPFELFLDYGLQMKARSKAEQTFLIQLSCDGGSYLPTPKAILGGGYSAEIFSNKVGPEGGQKLVDETVNLINEMWDN